MSWISELLIHRQSFLWHGVCSKPGIETDEFLISAIIAGSIAEDSAAKALGRIGLAAKSAESVLREAAQRGGERPDVLHAVKEALERL
jgi:hypothetical protein